MPVRAYSHVVGFDDAPFHRAFRGDVPIIGTVFAGLRLEGVMRGAVRRDGTNSTRVLTELLEHSKFFRQLQLILLQGIAFAGFNVIDIEALHIQTALPVLVVSRRQPRLDAIRRALLGRVPGGARKWALIERCGSMEPTAGVYVQRRGIGLSAAEKVVQSLAVHGRVPEPLRTAHLIAGGLTTGQSRGRA